MVTIYKKLRKRASEFLGPFVYGAIDGTVTTFAVVASSYGAGLSAKVVTILGFANLLGDGFSMGASSYAAGLSERQQQAKAIELYRTEKLKTEEKVRHSLEKHFIKDYGFQGVMLRQALDAAMSNEKSVIKHLLRDEFGVEHVTASRLEAFWQALATFLSFISIGLIPLLPYLYGLVIGNVQKHSLFIASMIMTAVAFLLIGYLKGRITSGGRLRAAFETFLLGAAAAMIAYGVSDVLAGWLTK